MSSKDKIKTTFPHTVPLLHRLNFPFLALLSPPTLLIMRMGNGRLWSVYNIPSLPLFLPHPVLLCSSMVPLPKILSLISFQYGSFPRAAVLQNYSRMSPFCEMQSFRSSLLLLVSSRLLCGPPTGCILHQGTSIHCSQCSSTGCTRIFALVPENIPLLFLLWSWYPQICLFDFFHSLADGAQHFLSCLKYVTCCADGWALASGGAFLWDGKKALSYMRTAPCSVLTQPLLQPFCYQNLALSIQYSPEETQLRFDFYYRFLCIYLNHSGYSLNNLE